MSRKSNSIKNMVTSSFGEILSILLKFITRSIFISTLGTQYLGITGLFANILAMLSLTELGLGTAITFNLYKPIARKDVPHTQALMEFYKHVYRWIGLVIGGLGLLILPFLPYIIKDDISFINVNVIFIIFLMQSVSSYLFYAYKSALIRAHQKQYVITVIGYFFSIATNLFQIIVLVVYRNFTLYVFSMVAMNVISNLYIAARADKMYPYLKERPPAPLPKEERKEIFKNSYALFFYKTNNVVLKSTDNIVLSYFIGLRIVGIYSNYIMVYSTIQMILNKFYSAISASLGDLHAREDLEYEFRIFKVINFFTVYIYGLAALGVYHVVNLFITVWIGVEYTLGEAFALLLALEIFIHGYQRLLATFRTSMGLFQQAKYRPIFGIVINIVLSVVLVRFWGIHGVLVATLVANLLTFFWFDPYVIFTHGFQKPVRSYYLKNLGYIAAVGGIGILSRLALAPMAVEGLLGFLLKGSLSVAFMVVGMHLIFWKTSEYRYLMRLTGSMAKSLRKRRKKS